VCVREREREGECVCLAQQATGSGVCVCVREREREREKEREKEKERERERESRSIRSGASGLPYYCAPPVCISAVIELPAVWRHNKPKPNPKPPVCVPAVNSAWGARRGGSRDAIWWLRMRLYAACVSPGM